MYETDGDRIAPGGSLGRSAGSFALNRRFRCGLGNKRKRRGLLVLCAGRIIGASDTRTSMAEDDGSLSLKALVFGDIVGSVKLKSEIGESGYNRLLKRYNELSNLACLS